MRLSDERTKSGRGLLGELGAFLEPFHAAVAGFALHSFSQLLSHKAVCGIKTRKDKSSAGGLEFERRRGIWKSSAVESKRLFAGVEVPASAGLRRALAELQRELRGERIRWTRLENLHLTVEFFGATAAERIPELEKALAVAAGQSAAFTLRFAELGTFGGARHPQVLWMGVESEGLAALHDRVAAELRAAGRTPEARAFAPHLTLGRIARLNDPEKFAAAVAAPREGAAPDLAIGELILFESVAGRYVPIGRWPLGSAG